MTTDKWSNPREAALDVVRDAIEEKKQTIDSGPLEGTEVVSIEDISEAFRTPLEPVGDFTAEVRTPGLVYVAGVCPACKETVNLRIDLTTELRIESSGRHLRLKGKSKEVTHYCGQMAIGLGQVEGQESFDLDAPADPPAIDLESEEGGNGSAGEETAVEPEAAAEKGELYNVFLSKITEKTRVDEAAKLI